MTVGDDLICFVVFAGIFLFLAWLVSESTKP